jgi:hypothetical protein
MATEIPIFTARTGVQAPQPVLQDPRQAGALGAMVGKAVSDLEAVGERVQAGVRVRALAEASNAIGELQVEVDAARDPSAIGPLVQQRRQEIEARLQERLGGDREGFTLTQARLVDNFNGLTRGAAARGRALEEDAFKATLLEQSRLLSARAATGDQAAIRDWGTLLQQSEGRLSQVELQRLSQGFRDEVDTARVGRLIQSNPAAAVAMLSDPAQMPGMDATRRVQLLNSATSRQQAQASMAYTNALRQDAAQRREVEGLATAAEKDIIDRTRSGDVQGAREALSRLRSYGTGESYARFEGLVNGREQDIPATPIMRAAFRERLLDRTNPLTRTELQSMIGARQINFEMYEEGLKRIEERQNVRFNEAEEFLSREMGVVPSNVPNAMRTQETQAREQVVDRILNDLRVERDRNPDMDPRAYVQQRLREPGSPKARVDLDNAQRNVRLVPAAVRDPEAWAQLEAAMATHLAAVRSRGLLGARPEPPKLADGTVVTPQTYANWKNLMDRLRAAEAAVATSTLGSR